MFRSCSKLRSLRAQLHQERGYIAIMSSIVIGIFLIACIATGSMSGWHARFTVLQTETKEQSGLLARGCAATALSLIMSERGYVGGVTSSEMIGSVEGECYIFPIATSTLPNGSSVVDVRVRARVADTFTNILLTTQLTNMELDDTQSMDQIDLGFPEISTVSVQEMPN